MATTGILYRLSSFRGEDFLEIDQPEARIANATMFVYRNEQFL